MSSYVIKARVKKPWFKPAYVVYDVVHQYQAWYDPSYGNGGGDYRECERVLATFDCSIEAGYMVETLNKYKGETK